MRDDESIAPGSGMANPETAGAERAIKSSRVDLMCYEVEVWEEVQGARQWSNEID